MLKRDLFRPPTLRVQNDPQSDRSRERHATERHATWLELFYDLVFVAAVSQLASNLNEEYTPAGLLRFAALFIPVWWAWTGHTFYMTRFDTDDVGHRLLTLAQIVAVAALTIYIPGGLGPNAAGFALAYAAVRLLLALQYLSAGRAIPRVRPLTSRYAAGFLGAAALWILSIFVPVPWRFGLWGLALVVDFFAPVTSGALAIRFPPDVMHLPERVGSFTIIVIGEAVAADVLGIGKGGLNRLSGLAGLLGLLIAFTIWWGYFDGVKAAEVRALQSQEQLRKYRVWLYAHLPFTMAITATAVSMRRVLALHPGERLSPFGAWLLCAGVGACMLMLNVIFTTSPHLRYSASLRRFMRPHYLLAYLGIGAGLLGSVLPGLAIVGMLTVCCILQTLYSLRPFPSDSAEAMHRAPEVPSGVDSRS